MILDSGEAESTRNIKTTFALSGQNLPISITNGHGIVGLTVTKNW